MVLLSRHPTWGEVTDTRARVPASLSAYLCRPKMSDGGLEGDWEPGSEWLALAKWL